MVAQRAKVQPTARTSTILSVVDGTGAQLGEIVLAFDRDADLVSVIVNGETRARRSVGEQPAWSAYSFDEWLVAEMRTHARRLWCLKRLDKIPELACPRVVEREISGETVLVVATPDELTAEEAVRIAIAENVRDLPAIAARAAADVVLTLPAHELPWLVIVALPRALALAAAIGSYRRHEDARSTYHATRTRSRDRQRTHARRTGATPIAVGEAAYHGPLYGIASLRTKTKPALAVAIHTLHRLGFSNAEIREALTKVRGEPFDGGQLREILRERGRSRASTPNS